MFGKSPWRLRASALVLTFLFAVTAFRLGVGADAREGIPEADLLTHIYYAFGLFVLGGLDLGVPTGGPPFARLLLWTSYFLAPAITTTALVEGILRILRPSWLRRRTLRDHVVIVGAGRLGLAFVELVKERAPQTRLVVLDRDPNAANAQLIQARFGARFYPGDVRNTPTLDALGVDRARAVILVTNDDLANLEAAWALSAMAPETPIIAHVADIGMRRTAKRLSTKTKLHLFNSHVIAAERLYREHLKQHFADTVPEDVIVLAGFGRFGQTILEYLQREAQGEVERVIVIDSAAQRQVRLFRAQVPGFDDCRIVAVKGDLEEPETWSQVETHLQGATVDPVYVIATDDDQVNLRTAIAVRTLQPEAKILVRTVFESRFAGSIAGEMNFTVLPVDHFLKRALLHRLTDWLPNS